jgi:hypothetical protein
MVPVPPNMKKALLCLLALSVSAPLFGANTKPIEETFLRYWNAYARKDFAKAAAEVLPADLDNMKTEVLPVFLAAQSNKNKEVQEMLGLFFGRVVGKARETLSTADVYGGLNRLVMAGDPQMFDQLKDGTTTIIFVRSPGEDDAEVHFQVTIRGESDTDAEGLTKKNGRWWIRIKDDPKATAAQFKEMFAAKS